MKIVLAGILTGRGGIQTHFFWLSRALLEAGHQVTVFSLGGSPDGNDDSRIRALESFGKFSIFFPYELKNGGRLSGRGAALVIHRALRNLRPDLFLACGTGWNLFLPAIMATGGLRRVFHEVMSGMSGNYRDSRWAVRYGFHEVVAQAAPVARNFKQTFGWAKPVPVLPAFPEPLEITATLPVLEPGRIPLGRARAAFFSRLVPHKQALWLVRQWPQLSDCLAELHICGTGPEEEAIRELIVERGWQDRVFCHGAYPEGQAYVDLLSSFDLTLLPTIGAEGAPLVLLESMACGVPFVSFDVGGIPDYANPDCRIVGADTPQAFVSAIEEMTAKLASGEVDSGRLRKFYIDHFSFYRLKQRWLAFFEKGRSG